MDRVCINSSSLNFVNLSGNYLQGKVLLVKLVVCDFIKIALPLKFFPGKLKNFSGQLLREHLYFHKFQKHKDDIDLEDHPKEMKLIDGLFDLYMQQSLKVVFDCELYTNT